MKKYEPVTIMLKDKDGVKFIEIPNSERPLYEAREGGFIRFLFRRGICSTP